MCSSKASLEVQILVAMIEAAAARLVQRVHHLAVDVELELRVCGVADAHRLRSVVARQPRQLELDQPPLAGETIEALQLRRRAGRRAQQPVAPGARFVVVAGVHQREQRQRRVAQPAEAVVPVARAANLLRQRGRRRRDDAAGRRVGQRFERHERSRDRVRPRAVGRGPAGPLGPERVGALRATRADRLASGTSRCDAPCVSTNGTVSPAATSNSPTVFSPRRAARRACAAATMSGPAIARSVPSASRVTHGTVRP